MSASFELGQFFAGHTTESVCVGLWLVTTGAAGFVTKHFVAPALKSNREHGETIAALKRSDEAKDADLKKLKDVFEQQGEKLEEVELLLAKHELRRKAMAEDVLDLQDDCEHQDDRLEAVEKLHAKLELQRKTMAKQVQDLQAEGKALGDKIAADEKMLSSVSTRHEALKDKVGEHNSTIASLDQYKTDSAIRFVTLEREVKSARDRLDHGKDQIIDVLRQQAIRNLAALDGHLGGSASLN